MKFINNILERRWRKKLDYYRSQSEYYYQQYRFKKDHVITFRTKAPIWMGLNSDLTQIKQESEEALKMYRYWNNKFRKLKKKLKNLN